MIYHHTHLGPHLVKSVKMCKTSKRQNAQLQNAKHQNAQKWNTPELSKMWFRFREGRTRVSTKLLRPVNLPDIWINPMPITINNKNNEQRGEREYKLDLLSCVSPRHLNQPDEHKHPYNKNYNEGRTTTHIIILLPVIKNCVSPRIAFTIRPYCNVIESCQKMSLPSISSIYQLY